MENSLTERMKKYAELHITETHDRIHVKQMFYDLQATMQALEVAREALYDMRIDTYYDRASMPSQQKCVAALKTIDSILGEKK